MATRKKSVKDIIDQRNRIQQEVINRVTRTSRANTKRYKKAGEAARRYIENIESIVGSTLTNGRHNEKAEIPFSRAEYNGTSNILRDTAAKASGVT